MVYGQVYKHLKMLMEKFLINSFTCTAMIWKIYNDLQNFLKKQLDNLVKCTLKPLSGLHIPIKSW
jgi:hypothetical protein